MWVNSLIRAPEDFHISLEIAQTSPLHGNPRLLKLPSYPKSLTLQTNNMNVYESAFLDEHLLVNSAPMKVEVLNV